MLPLRSGKRSREGDRSKCTSQVKRKEALSLVGKEVAVGEQ
jgi:hypothetical protein